MNGHNLQSNAYIFIGNITITITTAKGFSKILQRANPLRNALVGG